MAAGPGVPNGAASSGAETGFTPSRIVNHRTTTHLRLAVPNSRRRKCPAKRKPFSPGRKVSLADYSGEIALSTGNKIEDTVAKLRKLGERAMERAARGTGAMPGNTAG